MTGVNEVLESLYSKFILRDVFAKIVPGATILLGTAFFYDRSYEVEVTLTNAGFGGWLLILGFCWITGIAIQMVGEKIWGFNIYSPNHISEPQFQKRMRANHEASFAQKQQIERFVVLKEASFNQAMAGAIVLIIFTTKSVIDILILDSQIEEIGHTLIQRAPLIILTLLLIFSLFYSHHIHKNREWDYRVQVSPFPEDEP